MRVVLSFVAGCVFWHQAIRRIARYGYAKDDIRAKVLDGLSFSALTRLRDACDQEIVNRSVRGKRRP